MVPYCEDICLSKVINSDEIFYCLLKNTEHYQLSLSVKHHKLGVHYIIISVFFHSVLLTLLCEANERLTYNGSEGPSWTISGNIFCNSTMFKDKHNK